MAILKKFGFFLKEFFLAEIKPFFFLSTMIFLTSILVGHALWKEYPELAFLVIEALQEKFSAFQGQGPLKEALYIFYNNTLIGVLSVFLFFLLGLPPFFILFQNGLTIGLIITPLSRETGPLFSAAALIPHGILEIPSFLLSTALGFWLWKKFWKKITAKEPFGPNLKKASLVFFLVIVPLNFLAALIESFLTPLLAGFFA